MRLIIGGSSSSGKSHLTANILRHRRLLFDCSSSSRDISELRIFYCLPSKTHNINLPQDLLDDAQFNVYYGLPDIDEIGTDAIIVLDDMMSEVANAGDDILALFTRLSHHNRISVIFLTQNLFHSGGRGSTLRSLSLQSSYIIATKMVRDKRQLTVLARQMFPKSGKFINDVIDDAFSEPYSYLLFDLTQICPEILRIRSNIFPQDSPRNIVYVDRKLMSE